MIPMSVAAGHVKQLKDLEPLLKVPESVLESVTMGSYTFEARAGNIGGTNFWVDPDTGTSINALGLPNPGIREACTYLREAAQQLADTGKIIRVSIAGFSVSDYVTMAKLLMELQLDQLEIELNLGCPNVRDGGKQKAIFAFEPLLVREVVERVYDATLWPGLAVKLSPYGNPKVLMEVAAQLAETRNPLIIVTSNTMPNGFAFDGKRPALDVADGYGGIAGTALHLPALGQVQQFRRELPDHPVIGAGGVRDGRTLYDFALAGACAAQVGTAYFGSEDPKIFQYIAETYPSA